MRTSASPALVDAGEVAELRAAVQALTARVEQLEAIRPRDAADATLRQQLATSTHGLPFTSQELIGHVAADDGLRRALLAADCVDAPSIGCWLRANRGIRDGVAIEREGRQWRVHMVHMTCIDPIA